MMTKYISYITILFLMACDKVPSSNLILDLKEPKPLSSLKDFDIVVKDRTHGRGEIITRSANHVVTENKFTIDIESDHPKQLQRIYEITMESKKPVFMDNIDSLVLKFKLDVIVHPENLWYNLMNADNAKIKEFFEVKPIQETKYEVVYNDGQLIEQGLAKLAKDGVPFDIKIRLQIISGEPRTSTNPYRFSQAKYILNYDLNGFYR